MGTCHNFSAHVMERYPSTGAYSRKKEAEQSAAKTAVDDLVSKVSEYHFEETLGKELLSELLVKVGMSQVPPKFLTTMTGAAHSPAFTSVVEINGASYVGDQTKSKKEAEANVAFKALQAIKAQLGEPFFQLQLPVESDRIRVLEQTNQDDTHDQLGQASSLFFQGQVKIDSEVVEYQEHGPNETEEKLQGVLVVDLTDSKGKRSRNEDETF